MVYETLVYRAVNTTPEGLSPMVPELLPGAYVAVVGATTADVIEARRAGLSVRDGILTLAPGSCSVITLLRAPMAGTVVEQVMATETGGINIDTCRTETGASKQGAAGALNGSGGSTSGHYALGTGRSHTNEGRWPSNLVLVHDVECRQEGVKKVPASNAPGRGSRGVGERSIGFGEGRGSERSMPFYTDPDHYGVEKVSAWICTPDCPVFLLDQQSGNRRSAGMYPSEAAPSGVFGTRTQGALYADSGSASRFYPQCRTQAEVEQWVKRLLG